MTAMPDMASLSLADVPKLENLPLDILLIVLSYLNTARSVASLASTCKQLHRVVQANGWRIFARSHFRSLSLPQSVGDDDWMDLTRKLTWQSRSWDRRAFSVASLVPPTKKAPRNVHGQGGRSRMQTIPPHIIVDASSSTNGGVEEETVAWGAGEDVMIRRRRMRRESLSSEKWMAVEGVSRGFTSGKDDVTAVSILGDSAPNPGVLVGRASGHLHLLSTDQDDFGRAITVFRPRPDEQEASEYQKEIQHFDVNSSQDTVAMITKDNLLLYPLTGPQFRTDQNGGNTEAIISPTVGLSIVDLPESRQFRLLRTVRFMHNGDIALGMTSSPEPLRFLTPTPTGIELVNAAKLQPSKRCSKSYIYNGDIFQTVRGILPVSTTSAAGGSGSVVLSSFDDGTVRLQDLRSPSAFDTIYQDHFEVLTPVGPLVSYGMERFVAGSARTSTLKIFDFRWTKNYFYTDASPCNANPMVPTPKPLTPVPWPIAPAFAKCRHLLCRQCNLHTLARTDFYRPNCNIYLPVIHQSASPVYSLAKSSDTSSVIYAGLAGELVKMSLRDPIADGRESLYMQRMDRKNRYGYSYHESPISVVETGDGFALDDITMSQRVPDIRKQHRKPATGDMDRMRRLDDVLV